jgi:16S rRNA (uracil1498-N3)-methyltransferase
MLRLHVGEAGALVAGEERALPPAAARHVQVRRLQPGDGVRLFDGSGVDFDAEILRMGRSDVHVRIGQAHAVERELAVAVTLALAMPANERMDTLVEKATELGVAAIQPLVAERSVLRLDGQRAERKRAHWQAVAVAACEQCGRARVPAVAAVLPIGAWLTGLAQPAAAHERRLVLSLDADARPLAEALGSGAAQAITTLSGPEGGLSPAESDAARRAGFAPVGLGPRVLRADTAPLAVLAWLSLQIGR